MKLIKSNSISAFGGINFVFENINKLNINNIISDSLPALSPNSRYSWKDLFYSFLSVYYCGGDCIEDIHTNLRTHFESNPFVKLSSPDTILKRLSELATENQSCKTKRGAVEHIFNSNEALCNLNIELLSKLGVFQAPDLTLDYDNTIIFNEKSDSKMTYKRGYGYQHGVCTVNEEHILYVENRNGNSDAKSFQVDTLQRLFTTLEEAKTPKINHFRADAASYQYEVIELLNEKADFFYVGCRNSYVEKYFTQVQG